MGWRRAALAIAYAALLAPLAALAQPTEVVPAAGTVPPQCVRAHIDDYEVEEPIVMAKGTAICPNDITTGCDVRCKIAVQRVRSAGSAAPLCALVPDTALKQAGRTVSNLHCPPSCCSWATSV